MDLEAQSFSVMGAAAVLLACGLSLPGARGWPVVRALLIGAAIGAVAYPLALCLFMGFAGAASAQGHFWVRFRFAFRIYALSSILDAAPRGAAMGMLAGFLLSLRRARSPLDPSRVDGFSKLGGPE